MVVHVEYRNLAKNIYVQMELIKCNSFSFVTKYPQFTKIHSVKETIKKL